ncbi:hypothetical protein EUGRSUZ_E02355 [Eucalyptus grandis]|uniref:Uncharacterized protein n=2 Tax=Eucalyptus grandis TaxID=71139 RepID=A0ACC3KWF6_EUCGR|nr:hypothetical protein EUGRSUZ_E02355 [Eucalyptus grandis]
MFSTPPLQGKDRDGQQIRGQRYDRSHGVGASMTKSMVHCAPNAAWLPLCTDLGTLAWCRTVDELLS